MFVGDLFERVLEPVIKRLIRCFFGMTVCDAEDDVSAFGVDDFYKFGLVFVYVVVVLGVEIFSFFIFNSGSNVETTTTACGCARETFVFVIVFQHFRHEFVFVRFRVPRFGESNDVEVVVQVCAKFLQRIKVVG